MIPPKIQIIEQPPDNIAALQQSLITKSLLTKDRERATDVLLQLRYLLSRTVSSIEVK